MSTKKIITYGSLRKGMYNFEALEQGLKHIKTTKMKGYNLYSLGFYPYVVEGEGEIVVDVLEVEEGFYERIKAMELGAGYKEIIAEVDDEVGFMYVFTEPINTDLVESGDWVKYKTT